LFCAAGCHFVAIAADYAPMPMRYAMLLPLCLMLFAYDTFDIYYATLITLR